MGKNISYEDLQDDEIFDLPEDRWEIQDMCEKVKKKKVNGKKKGDSYELLVAKDLSKRFHDTFRRVPRSGAFMGGQNRAYNKDLRRDAQEILSGDIITPIWFPFVLECKNYKDTPKIRNLFSNGDKELDKWIKQARSESEVTEKPWVILFKVTTIRGKQFAVMDKNVFSSHVCEKNYPNGYIMYKDSIIVDYKVFFDDLFDYFYEREEDPVAQGNEDIEIDESVFGNILD